MINHARMLLLNIDGNQLAPPWSLGEDVLDSSYRAVPLSAGLKNIRRCLFGTNPDRSMLNYRSWQLLSVVRAAGLDEMLASLDRRVTYADRIPPDFASAASWAPQVSAVSGRIDQPLYSVTFAGEYDCPFAGTFALTGNAQNGFEAYSSLCHVRLYPSYNTENEPCWELRTELRENSGFLMLYYTDDRPPTPPTDVDAYHYITGNPPPPCNIVHLANVRYVATGAPGSASSVIVSGEPTPSDDDGVIHHEYVITALSSESARVWRAMPSGFDRIVAISPDANNSWTVPLADSGCTFWFTGGSFAAGDGWLVSLNRRPARDLSQMLAALDRVGEEALLELWQPFGQEPYASLRNMFYDAPALPQRLGAAVTALILQTERRRTGGGQRG